MASHANDGEEQRYQDEVKELKQWWTDSRWRHTRRPFTAEQIAQKRGNLKIEWPSNAMAKKLWKTVEERFAVGLTTENDLETRLTSPEPRCELHLRMS